MKNNMYRAAVATGGVLLLASWGFARAEDVEKRLRVSFAVGGVNTQDDVPSDAANVLTVVFPDGSIFDQFEDPRVDTASLGTLSIKPAIRYSFGAQYAFTKTFLLEGSVGYQKGDLGEIEVQGQFANDIWDTGREPYNFRSVRQHGGEITEVPVQLTAMLRFRPKATFNPFIGIGAGYTFVGFTPSRELNELSLSMDNSIGQFTGASPGGFGTGQPFVDLQGASVDAPDTFEWHASGGGEWTFRKSWSIFLDLRYTFASKRFRLGFNGSDSLGISMPNGERTDSRRRTPRRVSASTGPTSCRPACSTSAAWSRSLQRRCSRARRSPAIRRHPPTIRTRAGCSSRRTGSSIPASTT